MLTKKRLIASLIVLSAIVQGCGGEEAPEVKKQSEAPAANEQVKAEAVAAKQKDEEVMKAKETEAKKSEAKEEKLNLPKFGEAEKKHEEKVAEKAVETKGEEIAHHASAAPAPKEKRDDAHKEHAKIETKAAPAKAVAPKKVCVSKPAKKEILKATEVAPAAKVESSHEVHVAAKEKVAVTEAPKVHTPELMNEHPTQTLPILSIDAPAKPETKQSEPVKAEAAKAEDKPKEQPKPRVETITVSAVGMGVEPQNTISRAQALALAKRAAIVDGYRQLSEKIYGVKIEGGDYVKNMVIQRTTVKTYVNAMLRNANVIESRCEDGLCQVEMEVKLVPRELVALYASRP